MVERRRRSAVPNYSDHGIMKCQMMEGPARGPRGATGAGPQQEEEEEEEEQLVMVELSGILDSDFLERCETRCKILGIDTEKPILQVDKYVFAGEYADTLGTCVIFEEDAAHLENDGSAPQLKYKCHTVKKLHMTRTFLTERKKGDYSPGGVEWFQIKENDFSQRNNAICNFQHRKKSDVVAASSTEDGGAEESGAETGEEGTSDLSYELEKADSEVEDTDSPSDSLACKAAQASVSTIDPEETA